MPKKIRLFIFAFLSGPWAYAQNPVADSLKQVLEKATHDTTRLQVLDHITQSVRDFREWEPYNDQMRLISSRNIDRSSGALRKFYQKFFAMSLNNEAFTFECRGDKKKALELYHRSLKISKSIDEKSNMATTLNNIGFVNKQMGNISLALDCYRQSLHIRKEMNDGEGMATAYSNMAIVFHGQGDLGHALEYYQLSYSLWKKAGDIRGMSNSLNGMGGVYDIQGENTEAKKYYKKALALKYKGNDQAGVVTVLGNLAAVAKKEKDTASALRYFQKALKIAEENGIVSSTANCLNNVGTVYEDMGQHDRAMDYYRKSLDMRRSANDKQGISVTLDNIGLVYLHKNRYAEAEKCFTEGLKLSREMGFVSNIQRLSKSLYTLYKKQGKSAQALEMHELYTQMRDSVNNDNARKAVIKTQFKFEYEQKAAADSIKALNEKKLQQAQIEKNRIREKTRQYALMAGIGVLLIIGFFVFQRFRLRQKLKELRIRNKIASDLHDEVGSALSSITLLSGMAASLQGEQHPNMRKIEETSRETMENMSDIVWSIQPRNDKLTAVVNRMRNHGQQLFSSLGIDFEFVLQGEINDLPLNMEQRKGLYLVYKEALNNAAKYAGAQKITVTISSQLRHITMVITDNGKGFDTSEKRDGNGLYTMQERARLLKGELQVNSSPGMGTTVTLTFKTT